jgi:hypothetical protein
MQDKLCIINNLMCVYCALDSTLKCNALKRDSITLLS